MLRLLIISLGILAAVLLIIDSWPDVVGSPEIPTDCSEEDVPIMERLIGEWFEGREKK